MARVYSIIFEYDNNKTNTLFEEASVCILYMLKFCKGFVVSFLRGKVTATSLLITVYFIVI